MRGRKCVHGNENSKFTYHVNFQTATIGFKSLFQLPLHEWNQRPRAHNITAHEYGRMTCLNTEGKR